MGAGFYALCAAGWVINCQCFTFNISVSILIVDQDMMVKGAKIGLPFITKCRAAAGLKNRRCCRFID